MRYVFLIILFLSINVIWGFSYLSSAAIAIWAWYMLELFDKSNEHIAFREYILAIYGMNYLFSPALAYLFNQNSMYRMKLPEDEYFMLAIPCMFLLQAGLRMFKTSIFYFPLDAVRRQSELNRGMLVQLFYMGLLFRFINPLLPSDLAFFFYLLSGIRFVAAYGLYIVDRNKYKWNLFGILFIELAMALQQGMFHDFIMWALFFGLFWIYIHKPGRQVKLMLSAVVLLAVFVIQITKSEYRSRIGNENAGAGFSAFQDAVEKNVDDEQGLFNASNATGSLTRLNQAWIFASTANRMNQGQDYQGLDLMERYAEAAFLPRFLAPNKMRAGDKEIFNKYSGHRINPGTSMGLGFFADGYIANGKMGAYMFALALGLIFGLVFKIVEHWSKVSPFFILLIFPILNYAVRPDCETQTIMGHIVKGLFVFALVTWYYSVYFSKQIHAVHQEQNLTNIWKTRMKKSSAKSI